ncbi:MAG: methyltransferase domain-containing protein [Planctomycetes bacterium]|nr:methyltransferase domain-containing protein [Planctomycetota bacterium]
MKHLSEDWTAYQEYVKQSEQEMARSRRPPWRELSWLLAFLYCISLGVLAAAVRVLGRARPTAHHVRLTDAYFYVPEMALHKAIEIEALKKCVPRGQGLDLGCGNGIVGGILIQTAGLDPLVGIDLYPHQGAPALQNGYRYFIAGNIQSLPFHKASFDYAVCICVIEHVPQLEQVLLEVGRVVRPGGRFAFTTPSPLFRESTLGHRFFRFLGMRKRAEEFKILKDVQSIQYHYLSGDQWRQALESAGFQDVQVRGIFSRKQLLLYDLMNFQVHCLRLYFADKLFLFLSKRSLANRAMKWACLVLSAHFSQVEVRDSEATHYCITCSRNRDESPSPFQETV